MRGALVIFHVDLDSFYVSAERLRRPELRGRPVAVGGDGPRAVVASCSYEARRFGVRSAMPVARARKLCPALALVPPDFTYYAAVSRRAFAAVERFTPVVEKVSIDEAYLDMTGTATLHGPPLEAARTLRSAVLAATGLAASVGIAANRLVAKVATDFCKPDNVCEVAPGNEAAFLEPLPIERLPGCGKVTQAWLRDRGVRTLGELQRYPLAALEKHLGMFGAYLHDASWGRGDTEFHQPAKTRSISREETFDADVQDAARLRTTLWDMSSQLGSELRREGEFTRGVRLKLRYPPFTTVTRSRVLDAPTQLEGEIAAMAAALFEEHWDGRPLRLVGVGCVLADSPDRQFGLFEDTQAIAREERLADLRDRINDRFGPEAIRTGRDIK